MKKQIKVIGIGGGGCNAVDRMVETNVQGVEFVAINTDFQSLEKCKAQVKVGIGPKVTGGRGAGADLEKGRKAAEESQGQIAGALLRAETVIVVACLGKGTGSGVTPFVCEMAKSMGIRVVVIASMPFREEGQARRVCAESGLTGLAKAADELKVIPLDSASVGKASIAQAFRFANESLGHAALAAIEKETGSSCQGS